MAIFVTQRRERQAHQKLSHFMRALLLVYRLAHNGNLTNAEELEQWLYEEARRHVNTTSDSEILMNILAHELQQSESLDLKPDDIFTAVANCT